MRSRQHGHTASLERVISARAFTASAPAARFLAACVCVTLYIRQATRGCYVQRGGCVSVCWFVSGMTQELLNY